MKPKRSETDMASDVVRFLTDMGWEVYQEVEGPGGRCDIVAKRGQIQWAIECKLSFGMSVMEQAYNWLSQNRAHYVSVATPSLSMGWLQNRICLDYGIGVLGVRWNEIREIQKPRLNRKAKGFRLYEEQKTFCVAGGNSGGHFTPFKKTVHSMVRIVKNQPGIEFSELIKLLDHHYRSVSSAKSCLRGFIGSDVMPDLKCEVVGGKLRVFPA